MGLGHVMRCFALAQQLRAKGAAVRFVTRMPEQGVVAKIEAEGCEVIRLPEAAADGDDLDVVLDQVTALGARVVVMDAYDVSVASQRAIKAAGARLVCIDDMAEGHFVADVVLNQNIGARAEAYSVEPYTHLLLGPRYALLRRAFREAGNSLSPPAEPPRVLVMMGGADPENLTARVLAGVDGVPADFVVDVVVGAAFSETESLSAAARKATHRVNVHQEPPALPLLMKRASLAVSGAGSTCWELAYLGLPAILLLLARNQAGIAQGLHAAGFALSLGPTSPFPGSALRDALAMLVSDPDRRARMGAVGRSLVDGNGADRVAAEVLAA